MAIEHLLKKKKKSMSLAIKLTVWTKRFYCLFSDHNVTKLEIKRSWAKKKKTQVLKN